MKARAAQAGRTLKAFIQDLVDREAGLATRRHGQAQIDLAELERGLEELSEGPQLPTLPPDFSRADVPGEHG